MILYHTISLLKRHVIEKLEVLNPLNTLKRGYSITKFNDKVIKDIKDVKVDDNINISLDNGNIDAKIIGIKENINE